MYYIKSECSFDSAHFLKGYSGKCSNLHGHRWRVVAELSGSELCREKQTEGMLMYFGDLKKLIKEMCDELDHCLICERGSLRIVEVPFRPTAENFAHFFYTEIAKKGFPIHRVEVYETPTNCAVYEG